jgi:hypothetical protein
MRVRNLEVAKQDIRQRTIEQLGGSSTSLHLSRNSGSCRLVPEPHNLFQYHRLNHGSQPSKTNYVQPILAKPPPEFPLNIDGPIYLLNRTAYGNINGDLRNQTSRATMQSIVLTRIVKYAQCVDFIRD